MSLRKRRNILNNMMMDNCRKDKVYQAIITDLALTGVIKLEDAEMLLCYKIPDFLKLYDGRSVADIRGEVSVSDDDDDDEDIQ
jgi:hypothetical protein